MSIIDYIKRIVLKAFSSHIFVKILVIFFSLFITLTIAFSKAFEKIKIGPNFNIINLTTNNEPIKNGLDHIFSNNDYDKGMTLPLYINGLNNRKLLLKMVNETEIVDDNDNIIMNKTESIESASKNPEIIGKIKNMTITEYKEYLSNY